MKIAFVYPAVYDMARFSTTRKEIPPFGVLYLAAAAEETGAEVSIFEVYPGKISLDLQDFSIVAFSIPSSATYELIKESRFNNVYSKDALIIVGGVHANLYPEETLLDIKPDVVVIGEGERTVQKLIQEHKKRQWPGINGICYLEGYKVKKMPTNKYETNIDWIPFPARHLIAEPDFIMNDRLANTNIRMTHIMTTRGCPFACHFCSVFQRKMQYRSGANVKAELEYLIEKYRIEGFAIIDDNFTVNKTNTMSICRSIKNLGLKWSALSRVDTVDYELLQEMHDAGCIEIKFGVESGSNKMLKVMGKNTTANQIRNAINLASSAGLMVKLFLIHGYPGENMETTDETISLLQELKDAISRVSLFRFVPLPGSYVYKNAEKFRIKTEKKDWKKFHINHNNCHWWGDDNDFVIMNKAYRKLDEFINKTWPET